MLGILVGTIIISSYFLVMPTILYIYIYIIMYICSSLSKCVYFICIVVVYLLVCIYMYIYVYCITGLTDPSRIHNIPTTNRSKWHMVYFVLCANWYIHYCFHNAMHVDIIYIRTPRIPKFVTISNLPII